MSRRDLSTFAMPPDGSQIFVGDGPELLVYRHDGQPVYKDFCADLLVGMVCTPEYFVTVDASDQVLFRQLAGGRKIEEIQLTSHANGMVVSPEGTVAVLTSAGLVTVQSNGQQYGYPYLDLSAASYGPDQNSLGLGTTNGRFTAMDAATGAPWGTLELGAPVGGVAWCAQGYWLVVAGSRLCRVDGGATTVAGHVELDGEPSQLVVTSDGAIAAVLFPPDRVGLIELNTHRFVGAIQFRREIHGITFCRAATLGVGFDDGDASTIDLLTRANVRTEPHSGRGRNNWNFDMNFEDEALRAAVTYLRAGGAPIAEYHGAPVEEMPEGKRSYFQVGCLIFNMMLFACGGCLGISFMFKFLNYI